MFTGIITAQGALERVESRGADARLAFRVPARWLSETAEGDSIAVNGVCLTALQPLEGRFSADVSTETLSLTTLGELAPGDPVNLELALRASDRLGGHLVSGHVDGVAKLVRRQGSGRAELFEFECPEHLSRYIATKGSVCLNGVSLTVNGVAAHRFEVCIIPHTQAMTNLGALGPGDRVNIEVDMVPRYLERLLATPEGNRNT